jgi:hypothetical protein
LPLAAILSGTSQIDNKIRFTIRFESKQSFTKRRLFRPILTNIEAKKIFFTLFSGFDKIKQNVNNKNIARDLLLISNHFMS